MLPHARTALTALCLLAAGPDAQEGADSLAELRRAEAGFALLADERWEQASAFFEALLAEDPDSEAAVVGRARAAERRRSSSLEAEPDRLDPDGPFARMVRAAAATQVVYALEVISVEGRQLAVPIQHQPLPGAVEDLLAPWLVEEPGALLAWDFLLADLRAVDPAILAAALRAAEADPDAPLAPAIWLHAARAERDLGERVAWIDRAAAADPDGPFADDAAWELARMDADGAKSRWEHAVGVLETLVDGGGGSVWPTAAAKLARLHLKAGRPEAALPLLAEMEARGHPNPSLLVDALRERGRTAEAARRCREWLQELQATDPHPNRVATARWTLGEIELALGNPETALELFDAVRQEMPPNSFGPWTGTATAHWRAVVLSFAFPVSASVLHYLLMATMAGFGAVAVAGRSRRVRPFLATAAALALGVAGLQLGAIAAGPETLSLASGGYICAAVVRNLIFAAAGLALLPRAIARRGAILRAVRGRPEPRRLLSTAVWVACAVALMWAATMIMYLWAEPVPNAFFERATRLLRDSELSLLLEPGENPFEFALFVTTAAVQEELLFRFAMLGVFLAGLRRLSAPRKPAASLAVLFSSILFAVPHAGMVDPEWFKMIQVTLLGCVLGILCLRRGPGAAVIAHAAFNLSTLLFVAPSA